MNFRCLLGHDFKRLSEPVPVIESPFTINWFDDVYALGECKRKNCHKRSMVKCYGRFAYTPETSKSKDEWFKVLNEQYPVKS